MENNNFTNNTNQFGENIPNAQKSQDFYSGTGNVMDFSNFSKPSRNQMVDIENTNEEISPVDFMDEKDNQNDVVQEESDVNLTQNEQQQIVQNPQFDTPNLPNPQNISISVDINEIKSKKEVNQPISKNKKEKPKKEKKTNKKKDSVGSGMPMQNGVPMQNPNSNPTINMQNVPQSNELVTNGGFTIHTNELTEYALQKQQKRKRFILITGGTAIVLLLASMFILLLDMGVIQMPKKIDEAYAQYAYNYTNGDVKFYYDKRTPLYFTSDEDIISIYSEDKKNYIEISSTGLLTPGDVQSEYSGIDGKENNSEEHNGFKSDTIHFVGTKNNEKQSVYIKEIQKGDNKLVAALVISNDANETELQTLKKIYETVIFVK